MAEPSTIARPYAEAAFRLADAQGKLAEWSATLANLSAVAADERVRAAIGDPNLPDAKVAGLIIAILSGKLTGETENFGGCWPKTAASRCWRRSAPSMKR